MTHLQNEPSETELLKRLVARTTRSGVASRHADQCINFAAWQWHQGIALHGLMQAHAALDDEASLRFVREWVDAKLAVGERPKSINTTAPLLAALPHSTSLSRNPNTVPSVMNMQNGA